MKKFLIVVALHSAMRLVLGNKTKTVLGAAEAARESGLKAFQLQGQVYNTVKTVNPEGNTVTNNMLTHVAIYIDRHNA